MPNSGGIIGKTAAPSGTCAWSAAISASGHGGDDADLVAVLDGRLQAVEIADVFVIDIDIDEAAHLAILEDAADDAGVFLAQIVEQALDRGAAGFDNSLVLGVLPHGSGYVNANGHAPTF